MSSCLMADQHSVGHSMPYTFSFRNLEKHKINRNKSNKLTTQRT